VLANLSGKPDEPLPRLGDRKFIEIDRDNFSAVMRGMQPRLAFRVENTLTNDNTKMAVELRFTNMDDFEPEQVVDQVEPLKRLLAIRRLLAGLLAKLDGNDRLGEWLQEIVNKTPLLQQISIEAGVETTGSAGETQEESHE